MDINDIYDETEEMQKGMLPSEEDMDELESSTALIESNHRYVEALKANGIIRPELPREERMEKMEDDALRVYEEGLNNPNIQFRDRKAVADKVLEIRGVINKQKDTSTGGGNTFVFSNDAALSIAEILGSASRREMRDVSDG